MFKFANNYLQYTTKKCYFSFEKSDTDTWKFGSQGGNCLGGEHYRDHVHVKLVKLYVDECIYTVWWICEN